MFTMTRDKAKTQCKDYLPYIQYLVLYTYINISSGGIVMFIYASAALFRVGHGLDPSMNWIGLNWVG